MCTLYWTNRNTINSKYYVLQVLLIVSYAPLSKKLFVSVLWPKPDNVAKRTEVCWTPCCVIQVHSLLIRRGWIQFNSKRGFIGMGNIYLHPQSKCEIKTENLYTINKDLSEFGLCIHRCWLVKNSETPNKREKMYLKAWCMPFHIVSRKHVIQSGNRSKTMHAILRLNVAQESLDETHQVRKHYVT